MAITPEDGTGLETADTYVSVLYMETYLPRQGYVLEATLTTDQKEVMLLKATQWIEIGYNFRSTKKVAKQALEWPRNKLNYSSSYNEEFPELIKKACCLIAFASRNNNLHNLSSDRSILESYQRVGDIAEKTEYASPIHQVEDSPEGRAYIDALTMLNRFEAGRGMIGP